MSLDVHLAGERVGTLFPAGDEDYRFAYSPAAIKSAGAGAALLSTALPVRPEPFGAAASRSFMEGLLPEGPLRRRIASGLGVDPGDGYALLAELGTDCAGAVVFTPEDAGGTPSGEPSAWLGEAELAELVTGPPQRLVEAGRGLRFSLAGVHRKLALIRDEETGRWGRPTASSPSTHVLKPETGAFPDLVVNEMFCTTVAREAGLPVAETGVTTIAERRCLVSSRFDRAGQGTEATRVHQEDFCQALGFPPQGEEGPDGPDSPGFAEARGLLRAVGRLDDLPTLLAAAVCNYLLGNGNAHGKNFALLFEPGGPRLAPLYDVVSTVVYEAPIHVGMVLAEDYESEHAYLLELAQVCEECEFDFELFRELASGTAERIGDCLEPVAERAREEGWYAPVIDEIAELAASRAFGLSAEVEY